MGQFQLKKGKITIVLLASLCHLGQKTTSSKSVHQIVSLQAQESVIVWLQILAEAGASVLDARPPRGGGRAVSRIRRPVREKFWSEDVVVGAVPPVRRLPRLRQRRKDLRKQVSTKVLQLQTSALLLQVGPGSFDWPNSALFPGESNSVRFYPSLLCHPVYQDQD